ncbi:MAG: hypothetical protein IH819_04945 [Bacteroidetes bacterium]|nr:hypothetical protein [Bacteroidota bacterium]
MFKNYITSKYFMFFTKASLVIIFFLTINFFNSPELIHKEILHPRINVEDKQMVNARFIDNEFFHTSDTSSSVANKEEKSDWFYYVLGIIILIAAGFILKQRYEQYLQLKQNNNV